MSNQSRRNANKSKCCNSELSCKATAELQQEVDKDLSAPDKSLGLLLDAKSQEMDTDVNDADEPQAQDD